MKCKTIIATMLLLSITTGNLATSLSYAQSKEVLKTQISENHLNYINSQWWNNFNDEHLNTYIIKAIENNHDLKIASLRVEQYYQMTRLQFANELPQISAGFAPALMKLPESTSTSGMWAFPVNMTYELDLFLKNHDKTKAIKKDWEKSQIDERAAYIAVTSAVGATYFNIIRADKLIDIQKEIIADRKQIYELMSERNRVGLTSTADLIKANQAYVSATADLTELEKSRTTLLNNLSVLIGENPVSSEELKRSKYEDTYLVKIPESIPSEVITQRPDYMAAEKLLEKSKINVKVAKKEFLPSINIFGLMAFGASSFSEIFNWSNTIGALSASAMFNLFTGGRKISNLRLSKNQCEQLLHNYYNTNLKAIQEVNDSLVVLKQDDKKYKTNLNVLKMEEKNYKYSEEKYKEGLISYLDLLQRKENLLSLNKLVISNKIDCDVDYIGLYKATGTKLQ